MSGKQLPRNQSITSKQSKGRNKSASDNKSFAEEIISAHNTLRALHGVGPLTLDPALTKTAQAYANTIAKSKVMTHSQAADYGENLFMRSSNKAVDCNGYQVSLKWYDEIKTYPFNGKLESGCGHFTQLVWKETNLAGFGMAKTADGKGVYVVGQYKPPGNFVKKVNENVLKRLDGQITVPTEPELRSNRLSTADAIKNNNAADFKSYMITNENGQFKQNIIDLLNIERGQLGYCALRQNYDLEKLAQQHADDLKSKQSKGSRDWQFQGRPIGQNIVYSRVKSNKEKDLVSAWCDQRMQTDALSPMYREIGIGAVLETRPKHSAIVCFYA